MNQQNPSKISNIINNNKHTYSNFLKNNQYTSFKLQNIANNIIKAYFTNNSNNSILISDPTYKHSNNKVEINFYYYVTEKGNSIINTIGQNLSNINNNTTTINTNKNNTNINLDINTNAI